MGHNAHARPSRPKPEKPPLPAGPYVCLDGHEVAAKDVQRGIDNRPVGLCWKCRRMSPPPDPKLDPKGAQEWANHEAKVSHKVRLVPLVLKSEYVKRVARRQADATPEAMFTEHEAPHGFLDGDRVVALPPTMAEAKGKRDRR